MKDSMRHNQITKTENQLTECRESTDMRIVVVVVNA